MYNDTSRVPAPLVIEWTPAAPPRRAAARLRAPIDETRSRALLGRNGNASARHLSSTRDSLSSLDLTVNSGHPVKVTAPPSSPRSARPPPPPARPRPPPAPQHPGIPGSARRRSRSRRSRSRSLLPALRAGGSSGTGKVQGRYREGTGKVQGRCRTFGRGEVRVLECLSDSLLESRRDGLPHRLCGVWCVGALHKREALRWCAPLARGTPRRAPGRRSRRRPHHRGSLPLPDRQYHAPISEGITGAWGTILAPQ
jgi:hypothetical protein